LNQSRSVAGWVLFFSIAFVINGASQVAQPFRCEREVKYSEEGFTVIPLKKEGIALIRDIREYAHGKKKWRLEVLDTMLSSVWTTELELETRFNLVGYEYNPRHLYLLFREGDNESYNFELLTILFHEQEVQTSPIKFEINFRLTHFTIAGTSAVFGGHIVNEPAVILWSQITKQPKVLPGLFISDVSLLDVRMNQNQSFNVLLVERHQKENKKMTVRTYDQEGNLLLEDIILIEGHISIMTGLTSSLENEEMIVAGTYGENSGKQATGYFTAVVDPFNEQVVNYTDFSSLTHFTDYLSPRRAEKVKEKAKKQKDLGRMPDYKVYVTPYRIEERPEGFYLLSELYFPTSSVNSYPYGGSYYNPYGSGYYPYGVSPFSNRYANSPYSYNNSMRNTDIRTSQTMVMSVGLHGKPGKDVSMKLNEYKGSALEQVGDFIVSRDSICIVYKNDNELTYQKMTGDPDEKPTVRKAKIRLQNPSDVLKDEDENEGQVRFWYDKQFFVWGYQTLKDATREGDQTRHVFYITRFSLD
jgi:hypothetical protein